MLKNVHRKFPEHKATSRNCSFYPSNSPKQSFTLMKDKLLQQTFEFKKLQSANIWHFCSKKCLKQILFNQLVVSYSINLLL